MTRPRLLSSLKSRIAIFATALFVAAIWGMALHAAGKLREDERHLLSTQQAATAGFIADSIGAALQLRVRMLSAVAAGIDPAWIRDTRELNAYLRARQAIYRLFPKGICVLGKEGRCLADFPSAERRIGAHFGDEDYFRKAVATGRPVVDRPRVDPLWGEPSIMVAVPIAGAGGEPVAVLAGTMPIGDSDLFQAVTNPRTPTSASVTVVAPGAGAVIIDTESKRILEPLASRADRWLSGFVAAERAGTSSVVADHQGVERLASAARIAETDWLVVVSITTERAFAPISGMVDQIYISAGLLSLLVASLIWLFVRRELAVLQRSAAALNGMTTGALPFRPLPVEGSEEIAQMVESFNDLQEQVVRQQAALKASEMRFRQMFEGSSWITYLLDPATHQIVEANRAAAEFWGYSAAELQGMDIARINLAPPEMIADYCQRAIEEEATNRTWQHRLKNGEVRDVQTFICPLQHGNRMLLYVVGFDVTERKRREAQETQRSRIFELLARGGDLQEILGLVIRYVEQTPGSPMCWIMLLDENGERLVPCGAHRVPGFLAGAAGLQVGEGLSSCGTAAHRNERVIVADVQRHPFWAGLREQASRAGIAACWSEPIRDSSGKVLGTFGLFSRTPGPPSAADVDLIQQAANLAAVAIEKKRTDAELQLASSVYQASDEAIVVTDADNRVVAVNPAFTRVTGYTLDEVRGRNPAVLASGRTTRIEYEAMWRALRTAGQWQGEIWNRRKNGEEYAEWLTINTLRDANGDVHRYIAMFSDITEKKRTAELVWRQANYDSLTGLPNRNLFYDRLNQEVKKAHRGSQLLALLYIDLDRFKEVNDAYGHDAGDLLLSEAATRIAACVRDADTVARLSGDEFAVVLPGVGDVARVEQVAKDIVARLAQMFHIGNHTAYVSASVGIAVYPNDADEAEALLKAADRAMYAAKEGGRNGFSYFTDSMQSAAQVRMQLSTNLREALSKGQFEVFYQPIVDLHTRRIVKAEALLRWRHPEHGLIQPSAFIPLAEEIGLIGEIGDWVFREAALVAKHWQERNPGAPLLACPIQISINKSPRQFMGSSKRESWLGYLREIGLPTQFVAMEITESLLLEDSPEVAAHLADLRASGLQVALDDFGTGYSSMGYLNKFRVDYVKIDRSFVQGIGSGGSDRAIVEAIVVMAHKLGLKVIAEGVETEAQCEFLDTAGCDYAQGYLFAKPLPREEFETLLFAGGPASLADPGKLDGS